jgi:hypothetical protein
VATGRSGKFAGWAGYDGEKWIERTAPRWWRGCFHS